MVNNIAVYLKSSTQANACQLVEFIQANDKTDHVHYGCSWEVRLDGIWHLCNEQKREWKVTADQ